MTEQPKSAASEKVFQFLLGALAGGFILLYAGIALVRMGYPFEFEWMEGGQVDHVLRILHGQSIYGEPSPEFVTFVYNPLYYYLAAGLSWILGPGFIPLRLLSFLASVGIFAILFRLVHRETGSRYAALISAGLFAATYPLSGGWFDLGRVDSLFLCFLLAGFYKIRFDETLRGAVLAGLLFFLSFLVKQSAVIPAAAMMLFLLFDDRRRSLVFAALSVGLSGLAVLLLNAIHHGWYMYVVTSAGNIPIEPPMILGFWTRDLAPRLLIATVLSGMVLAGLRTGEQRKFRFHIFMAAILLALAWLGRIHNGGFINVLMPVHLELAILTGLFVSVAFSQKSRVLRFASLIPLLAQFCFLIYPPERMIPSAQDRRAGEEMIRRLRGIPGDVLIPYHGYYSTLAGKKPHAHIMTMIEVVISGDAALSHKLVDEIRGEIHAQRYGAIVLDREWFREDVEKYYVKAGRVFENDSVFWPVTGVRTRPEWIYVPRKP